MPALFYLPWFQAQAFHIPLFGGASIPLQPFGLLVATGVFLGYQYAEWRGKKEGIHPETLNDMVGYVLGFGFVSAHMLDAIFYHPKDIAANPIYLFELWAGISSYGGFFGAILGGFVWRYRRKLSFLTVGDPIVFAFPVGWLFGRMGCFVVHDHPGIVTTFPLAVADYHVGNPPFQPRHDLGFYEVLFCLVIIPLFAWLGTKKRPPGFYMGLLPVLYAPFRFCLDFLRIRPEELGDEADPRYFGLTPGHYGSVLMFFAGLAVLYVAYNRKVPPLPDDARWPQIEPDAGVQKT